MGRKTTTTSSSAPPRSRRRRRWVIGVLVTPLVLLVGLIATQGWWLPALVRPSVQRWTGLELDTSSMRLTWGGRIKAHNFALHQPDSGGAAIVSASRVEATLSWRRLFTGRLGLSDIVLQQPIIRVSADTAGVPAGEDAFEQARRGLRAFGSLPEVEIIDGRIEFVERDQSGGGVLVAVSGGGTLRREFSDHVRYEVKLLQTGDGDAISVEGWIDLTDRTAQLRTGELDLSRWIDSFVMADDAAFWRSIVTGGRLISAQLDYTPEHGVVSNMDIEGMRLAMPMPNRGGQSNERLILDAMSGRVSIQGTTVHASVEGLVDGLPTTATIDADGLSLTAPFRCSFVAGPFMMDRDWKPLALVSDDVQSILQDFSGPSAEISARIDLNRESPSTTVDGGIDVTGEAQLEHGFVSFVLFPYPVREIAGTVTFEDDLIYLKRLTGEGPTGAQLTATGIVYPDPTGVGVELSIHAEKAPVDEHIFQALTGDERQIVESLFDEALVARLAAEGVFAGAAQKREAQEAIERLTNDQAIAQEQGDRARLDSLRTAVSDLRRVADRPTFDLSGLATVDIQIGRDAGPDPERRLEVDARLERAGLLFTTFPYPVFVEPLVIHIDHDSVDVIEAPLVGLTGAEGEITGRVTYETESAAPELSIQFSTIPIDEALLATLDLVTEEHAQTSPVRTTGGLPNPDPAPFAGDILRGLGARGAVSGEATIQRRDDGEIEWNVETSLAGLELQPDAAQANRSLLIDAFSGVLSVQPDAWRVHDGVASVNGDPVRFVIDNPFGQDESINVTFDSPTIRAETPIEDLLHVIDSDVGESIARLRSGADLAGPVSIKGVAAFGAGVESRSIELSGAGELALTIDGRTSRIRPRSGRVVLDGDTIRIEDVSVELLDHLGASSGVVDVTGVIAPGAEGSLSLVASNLAIETPLVREAIRSLHPNLAMWFDEAEPAGRLDAEATLARTPEGVWRAVTARAEPKSLRFVAGAERIAVNQISGAITLRGEGGRVENLRAVAPTWSVNVDGSWFSGGTPGALLTMSARGERLSDDILALLPEDVSDVFRSLDIGVEGGFELKNGSLAINAPVEGEDLGDGFRDGIRFSGVVECAGASINAGVPFTRIDGSIAITAERAPYSTETIVDVGLELDSLRAAALTVNHMSATIRSATDRDHTLAVRLLGECHRGRIWGEGEIRTADAPSHYLGGYEFDLRLAGLDLATAMHEYAQIGDGESSADAGERGFVDASLILAGDLDAGATPRGAGEIRILGGELIQLPLIMTILELGNVIPPIGERLDYARADFSLANGVATFDRLLAVSKSMALVGEGTMTLPEFGLNLQFGTAGNYRMPLFSSIFDVLRNELLTTRVQGTLAEPQFSVVQLTGTRRLLSSIFGGSGDDSTDDGDDPVIATVPEDPN